LVISWLKSNHLLRGQGAGELADNPDRSHCEVNIMRGTLP